MKTMLQHIWLIVLISLLSACQPAPIQTVEVTRGVNQTVEVTRLVPQTVEVTRLVSPTAVATLVMTETPSPEETLKTVNDFELSALLQIFPIYPGSSWAYTGLNYSQAGADPNTILKAVTYITERVIDTQNQPPFYFAHIQRITSLVKADSAWWQYNTSPFLGTSDFWYVVQHGRVYLSADPPDPAKIQLDQLSEELDLPLGKGVSWCPNKILKGSLEVVAATPFPCQFAGARKVLSQGSYHTQAGNFDPCYRLVDFYNSGSPSRWFCDGVGFVADELDHQGSSFGASKALIQFTRGPLP